MAIASVNPLLIKAGPGLIRYAPLGTTIPTFTAAANKVVGTWTNWVAVGATDEGLTYSEGTDTEDITVAESQYPVRTVTTAKSGTVAFAMSHIDDLNWKLACNGGTITTSGTGATKINTFVPPLVGGEVRVMLGFQSLDDDEVIIWPQVFNGGGFETGRSTIAAKHLLPVTFNVELPDPAVLTTPYKRWTTGSLAAGV
jgi:hypothetical protein